MELIFDNIIPVRFYPYPHIVLKRIIESKDTFEDFQYYRDYLLDTFSKAGIIAMCDNKIVFEVEVVSGNFPLATLYIGFYDWIMSIGFMIHKER